MEQRTDYRAAVDAIVDREGTKCNVLGLAIWTSPVIYAVVLGLIFSFGPPPVGADVGKSSRDFLNLLAAVLAAAGVLNLPLPFLLLRLLTRTAAEKATAAAGPGLEERLRELSASYLRAALVASGLAEAPAVFALVLGLCLHFVAGAGFTDLPWVGLACAGLGLLSLLLLGAVIPTAGRLERFLLQVCEEDAYTREEQ